MGQGLRDERAQVLLQVAASQSPSVGSAIDRRQPLTDLEEQIRRLQVQGFQVEIGPNGFLDTKPSTRLLCADLGLGPRLIPASTAAARNRSQTIVPIPYGKKTLCFFGA